METDSEIFVNDSATKNIETSFHSPVLLKTTAYARLFRVSRGGRYFVIKTTKDNNSRQRELLRREYELSLGCEHQHIVNILFYEYETLVGEGIVMQYVDGCTLREYLATSPSKNEKNRLFSELLSAVACLHKRGVVHNDLKPENILITNNGHSLKLIDFGLAGDDAHYMLKTPGCTLAYASPELRGGGNADVRSDIYSLGVIMKEMLGSSAIAKRCMAELPSKRYANIDVLQKAWLGRKRKRNNLLAVAAVFLLLLPLGLHVNDKIVESAKADAQKLFLEQVESDIERFYVSKSHDISNEVYLEFASMHIKTFWDSINTYKERRLHGVDNAEFRALVDNVLMEKAFSCGDKLKYQSDSLPMFTECVTDLSERLYYFTLLGEGKPFVPYSAGK